MCVGFLPLPYLYGGTYSPILVMKLSNVRSATGLDTFVLTCTVWIHLNIHKDCSISYKHIYIYIYYY